MSIVPRQGVAITQQDPGTPLDAGEGCVLVERVLAMVSEEFAPYVRPIYQTLLERS